MSRDELNQKLTDIFIEKIKCGIKMIHRGRDIICVACLWVLWTALANVNPILFNIEYCFITLLFAAT